jgi:hypothetical protein
VKLFTSFDATFWLLLMFLDHVLFGMNWLLKHSWKKLGPLGVTVITWAAITLFAFLLPGILTGCGGPSVNNTTKEDKTMILRFSNSFNFALPAAPGSIRFYPTITAPQKQFGVVTPYNVPPESEPVPVTDGMNPQGNARIIRYRYRAVGAPGLRVGYDVDFAGNTPPFVALAFNRTIQGSTSPWPYVSLPYTYEGEWVETSIVLEYNGTPGFLRPQWQTEELLFDTREMNPSVYGKTVKMFLEIDIECNQVGF